MSGRNTYRPGDYLVIDDRTGFPAYASETRMEWNGSRVHESVFEERHPQDFVRGVRDDQTAPGARPRPTQATVGPLTTSVNAAAAIGGLTITVVNTARMLAGDSVLIEQDNNEMHQATLQSINSPTEFVISPGLSAAVSVGNVVINRSAVTVPSL